MITDAVRDLYVARWGVPSRNARFEADGATVEIFKWDADANPEGVNLYATIGASAQPMAEHDPTHRVEFHLGLLPAKDDIASPLASLALFPHTAGEALDHGHTVSVDEPLWPGTEMRRFLIMRPLADIIPPLMLPDGVHVEFLQAIPIFEAEQAYKREHTADALMQRWEASLVPFWDPNRSPNPAE